MDYACYLDDTIMESEGEKGLGSLSPTIPDLHYTERKPLHEKDL